MLRYAFQITPFYIMMTKIYKIRMCAWHSMYKKTSNFKLIKILAIIFIHLHLYSFSFYFKKNYNTQFSQKNTSFFSPLLFCFNVQKPWASFYCVIYLFKMIVSCEFIDCIVCSLLGTEKKVYTTLNGGVYNCVFCITYIYMVQWTTSLLAEKKNNNPRKHLQQILTWNTFATKIFHLRVDVLLILNEVLYYNQCM